MEGGRLDQDLCRALAPETVEIPALRERIEDIALLSRHFIETICTINHLPPIRLTSETISLLEHHGWTENVEGLRSAMEHAVILAEDGKIGPGNLPDRIVRNTGGGGILASTSNPSLRRFRDAKREVVESFERSYLCDLMKRFDGNVTAASQRAGMLRSALQRLLRKYGLRSAEFRKQRRPVGAIRASRPRD
jgi:DNA-binding NtrC family response regulator